MVSSECVDAESSSPGEEVLSDPGMLKPSDIRWLEALRGQQVDAAWLDAANALIEGGPERLGSRSSESDKSTVMQIRRQFYGELLGWSSKEHSLHGVYTHFLITGTRRAPPIKTVIGAQRFFDKNAIDPVRLLAANPTLLALSGEYMEARFTDLENEGLNAPRILNAGRANRFLIFASKSKVVDRLKARFGLLNRLGISDPAKAISREPSLFTSSPEYLTDRFSDISERGIDATKVIGKYPQVVTFSPDIIQSKCARLEQLGLDPAALINRLPAIITMHSDSIEKRFHYIQRLGKVLGWEESTAELVHASPQLLSYSNKKLRAHARIFAEHGRADTSISQIKNMCIVPLEYHLLSLARSDDYTVTSLHCTYKRTRSGGTQKEQLAEIIADPASRSRLGEKIVKAYCDYAQR